MKLNIHITLATAIAILVGAWQTACNNGSHEVNNDSHEVNNDSHEVNCDPGYHVYDNTCEEDSTTNCGSHGKECNIENATTTICSDGICKATDCDPGYHVYDNTCEEDSKENCGAHDKVCLGKV